MTPSRTDTPAKDVLTVKDASVILDVHEITIRRLIDRGELPAWRVGRLVKIDREDVFDYKRRHLYSR